jgi:hypothetical protein
MTLCSALALVATVVALATISAGRSQEIAQSYSGTGEPVRFILEPPSVHAAARQSRLAGPDLNERHPMGKDGFSVLDGGMSENGHSYAGTGDPDRSRFKLSVPDTRKHENGHTYAGTGDQFRYQAP